jgi:hypothetical protein
MNPQPALADHLDETVQAHVLGARVLQCDTRGELAGVNAEHGGTQQRIIIFVKRAVEEDLTVVRNGPLARSRYVEDQLSRASSSFCPTGLGLRSG